MDVFPPLPTPGRKNKQKMVMKKKQEPDLVDIKAGQMTAELEMKLLDLSSGLLFLQDSQVLPASSPGVLQSKFLFSVLFIPYFQSFHKPAKAAPRPSQSSSTSLLCKQPCLGGPKPRHPHHQPQHQVCCTLTHSLLVLLFIYFQSYQLPHQHQLSASRPRRLRSLRRCQACLPPTKLLLC